MMALPAAHSAEAGAAVVAGAPDGAGGSSSVAETAGADAWLLGVGLSFSSMLLRSLKTVVMERSLRRGAALSSSGGGEGSGAGQMPYPSLRPTQLVVVQTPGIALTLLLLAAIDPNGLQAPIATLWGSLSAPSDGNDVPLVVGIAVNVVAAGCLNFVGSCVLQQLGATTMQIVGKCNTFVVMAFSAAYVGEAIAPAEVLGAGIVLVAAYLLANAGAAAGKHQPKLPPGFLAAATASAEGRGCAADAAGSTSALAMQAAAAARRRGANEVLEPV